MNRYWVSDLHFRHSNICKYTARPWAQEDNTEALIEIWNSQVKPQDEVWHLGDFCFGGPKALEELESILRRLNGKKHLVRGNHCDSRLWKQILVGDDTDVGVYSYQSFKEIKVGKTKVVMCHYPFEIWNQSHHGSFHLHGHSHGTLPSRGKRLDVGIDNAYKVLGEHRLFTWEDITDYMKDLEPWCPDHHQKDTY